MGANCTGHLKKRTAAKGSTSTIGFVYRHLPLYCPLIHLSPAATSDEAMQRKATEWIATLRKMEDQRYAVHRGF